MAAPDTVRILTWNLWARFGPWEARQGAILEVLRRVDADVIGLQEVWSTDDADQLVDLAQALGYHAARPSDPRSFGFGNAVLSRWEIDRHDWAHLSAGDAPKSRTVLHARIAAPFGRFDFFTTHLAYRFDQSAIRSDQVADLADFVAERRGDPETSFPPVLCGDLNAVPESDEIRRLLGLAPVPRPGLVFHDAWAQVGDGPGATWHRDNPHVAGTTWPDRRLDYVLVGWPRPKPVGNPQRAWLVGTEPVGGPSDGIVPSDHYGVAVELAVTG